MLFRLVRALAAVALATALALAGDRKSDSDMSIFGGGSPQASQAPAITGIGIQTSVAGKAVPLVYGATRVPGNLIGYGDFASTGGQSSSGKGGGGGGGGKGGGKGGSGQTTFSASVMIGLCEGPIAGFGVLYNGKSYSTVGGTFAEFLGGYPQAPWGHLPSGVPAALGYSGLAYVAAQNLQLGASAQLPNFGFEILGALYATAPSTYGGDAHVVGSVPAVADILGGDADPSLVAVDLLTNAFYGAGFPASRLGTLNTALQESHAVPAVGPFTIAVSHAAAFQANLDVTIGGVLLACVAGSPASGQYAFSSGVYTFNAAQAGATALISYSWLSAMTQYQSYALASGLWISPLYDNQQAASTMLDEIAQLTNAEWIWSSGVLTLVPRGAVPITANGHTYTPPGAPLFDLTDDDFLKNTNAIGASAAMNDDPVLVTVKDQAEQENDVKLECLDRANFYNTAIVEAYDQGLIDRFTRLSSGSQTAHIFCDVNAANTAAQLLLQRQYILKTYQFTLDQRYCVLDLMDIVTLTDATQGIVRQPVRILEITEQNDGTLTFMAEEYPASLGAPPVYSFQTSAAFAADYNAAPGNVNPPVIFEPTFQLGGEEAVWVIASGGAQWGGAQVLVSTDGNTYQQIQPPIAGQGKVGVLNAALPAVTPAAVGPTIDQVNTLAVDISESAGAQLLSATQADALAGNTACYVDGEIIGYQTATLGSAQGRYALSTLIRGMFGTPIKAHSAGAQFARLPAAVLAIPFSPDRIGQTIFVKLLSFNLLEGGLQSQASVSPYTYVIQGVALSQPLPNVTNLQQGYAVNNAPQITWSPVIDPEGIRVVDYEVRGPGVSPQSSQVLGRTPLTNFLPPSDGTFWVAAHYRTPQGLDVYSGVFQSVAVTLPFTALTPLFNGTFEPAFSGTLGGAALIVGNGAIGSTVVELNDTGNILTVADYLNDPNILFGGGVAASGTYQAGPVLNCMKAALNLLPFLSYGFAGVSVFDNWLTEPNILADPDILQWTLGAAAQLQIQYGFGGSISGPPASWSNWVPGQQIKTPRALTPDIPQLYFLFTLSSGNPQVEAELSHLSITVNVVELDQGASGVAVPAAGLQILYPQQPYNTKPVVTITILNEQAGDIIVYSDTNPAGFPASDPAFMGFNVQITNGGVGVPRTINWKSAGF